MKQKLVITLLLGAFGTTAHATCQYTPQGCPSPVTPTIVNSPNSNSSASSNSTSSATSNTTNHVHQSQHQRQAQHQAQKQRQHQSQVASGGQSSAVSLGGTQGQSVSVDAHSDAAKRAAASAYAAPLTSSNDTCMGSSSGAVQAPGLGVSIGSTWTDKNCVMLKNSRELWNMGLKEAALARMCMDADNRDALESSGVHCPAPKKQQEVTSTYTGNDPIVRRRLGLN